MNGKRCRGTKHKEKRGEISYDYEELRDMSAKLIYLNQIVFKGEEAIAGPLLSLVAFEAPVTP